jgi:mono/diheme cytochrome c family protein
MNRSAAAALVLGLLLPLSAPRAQDDAAAGRKLAVQHCARCHVVGDHNPYGGIGSTPSFQWLAKRADYLERFSTFFERRPHPVYVRVPGTERLTDLPSFVAEFTVTPRDIEDLIAFVETLKAK